MTLFNPPADPPRRPKPAPPLSKPAERGGRVNIDRMAQERARIEAYKARREAERLAKERAGIIEINGVEEDPRGRGGNTDPRGRAGLHHYDVLDREPHGVLFTMTTGFFDKHGYWCTRDNEGKVTVHRGASKGIMRHLTDVQRKTLDKARLNARRAGVR